MDDPSTADPIDGERGSEGASADRGAGDRPPSGSRRLDRPPSERYAREPVAPAGPRRGLGRAVVVALVGAGAITFLGGPLSLTAGLLAVSVVVGLVIGAVLRPATIVAVGLASGSVAIGLLGVWLFARAEGGVLDPITYLADVEGPLAPIQLIAAGLAAIVSSR